MNMLKRIKDRIFKNNSNNGIEKVSWDAYNMPLLKNIPPMPKVKQYIAPYDYIKNIKHLIERYNNKIASLCVDVEAPNETYDNGIGVGLQTAIHDLEDILDELEV